MLIAVSLGSISCVCMCGLQSNHLCCKRTYKTLCVFSTHTAYYLQLTFVHTKNITHISKLYYINIEVEFIYELIHISKCLQARTELFELHNVANGIN